MSEPDTILKAENEALQDEVRHLRQLLSLAGVSTKTAQLSNSACAGFSASSTASQSEHAQSNPKTLRVSDPEHKHSLEARQANSSAHATSSRAGLTIQQSSLSTAARAGIDAVQLKREELLKWKAVQLERQVTILQGALEVMPCPTCRRHSHIDMQCFTIVTSHDTVVVLSHQLVVSSITFTISCAAPSSQRCMIINACMHLAGDAFVALRLEHASHPGTGCSISTHVQHML